MLTRPQYELLQVIQQYQRKHGYPPTLREAGDALGISSHNGVVCHLKALIRKGFLSRARATGRGMQVIRPVAGLPLCEVRGGKVVEVGVVVLDAAGRIARMIGFFGPIGPRI